MLKAYFGISFNIWHVAGAITIKVDRALRRAGQGSRGVRGLPLRSSSLGDALMRQPSEEVCNTVRRMAHCLLATATVALIPGHWPMLDGALLPPSGLALLLLLNFGEAAAALFLIRGWCVRAGGRGQRERQPAQQPGAVPAAQHERHQRGPGRCWSYSSA